MLALAIRHVCLGGAMRNHRICLVGAAVSLLAILGTHTGAKAATLDEVLARLNTLEKETATLRVENATLRARVNRIETSKTTKVEINSVSVPRSAAPQDAYASMADKAPVQPIKFTWTGCYIGAQGGTGILNDSYTGRNGFGGLVGGQVGCNYQIERFVVGLEGKALWSGLSNDNSVNVNLAGAFDSATDTTTKNKWDADVSLRLGLLLSDRILSYAKIGAVWGGFDYS